MKRSLVSAVILAFLLLQFVAGFKVLCPPKSLDQKFCSFLNEKAGLRIDTLRICCAPKLWPFLDYHMYNNAFFEGDELSEYFIVAKSTSGEQIWSADFLDLAFRTWRDELVIAFLHGDKKRIQATLDRVGSSNITELRLENRPLIQKNRELVRGEARVLRRFVVISGRVR